MSPETKKQLLLIAVDVQDIRIKVNECGSGRAMSNKTYLESEIRNTLCKNLDNLVYYLLDQATID